MSATKLKVTLLSHTLNPEAVVAAAINQCYSAKGGSELKESIPEDKRKRLIDLVVASGHHSTIEHASFSFAVEGVSRALTHQLVRHRVASFSQQSQRYVAVKQGDFSYIIPPAIAAQPELKEQFEAKMQELGIFYSTLITSGILPEDARSVLPNAAETKIVITMNARELLHFFQHRLCIRAQLEIRQLAAEMLKLVQPLAPNIFAHAGPTCETEQICWEGNLSCGKWKAISGAELRNRST